MFPATSDSRTTNAGEHVHTRRCAAVLAAMLLLMASSLEAGDQGRPIIDVREEGGVYHVTATFDVDRPAGDARSLLTDYDRIPRFMPAVRSSRILERAASRVVVAQEVVARFMVFSRRISLVLEIEEGQNVIRFRDRLAESFEHYSGSWTMTADEQGGAQITYALSAKPSFSVPGSLLKRLLRRDAVEMIERLQREILVRAQDVTAAERSVAARER